MNPREIAACVLLTIGVLGFVFTSVGVLLSGDVFDRIHYLAPGSLVGSVAIAAAVVVDNGFSQASMKAILIAILLLVSNPVLSHATARAARIRRKQQLQLGAEERIPFTELEE
ncbi:MAG TPA: monovalent cation/H(+) antiporter subunit G [Bryobacteraceae bacterium]|jgi:multicomponent Na+:H+ antiporter subunit G|nr:monovalent cation/H(+) antiporter subunit G [Bryobacteraceae bacterium]